MNSKEVKYIRVTAVSDEEIQADMYLVGDEDSKPLRIRKEGNEFILMHEYGHSIQSLILGPLFIPLIAIPSFIWASSKSLKNYRQRHKMSYYDLYTEKWANNLGMRVLKNRL